MILLLLLLLLLLLVLLILFSHLVIFKKFLSPLFLVQSFVVVIFFEVHSIISFKTFETVKQRRTTTTTTTTTTTRRRQRRRRATKVSEKC